MSVYTRRISRDAKYQVCSSMCQNQVIWKLTHVVYMYTLCAVELMCLVMSVYIKLNYNYVVKTGFFWLLTGLKIRNLQLILLSLNGKKNKVDCIWRFIQTRLFCSIQLMKWRMGYRKLHYGSWLTGMPPSSELVN